MIYVIMGNYRVLHEIPIIFLKKLITGNAAAVMYYIFVYCEFTLLIPVIDKLARSKYKYIGFLITPMEIIFMRVIPLVKGYELNKYLFQGFANTLVISLLAAIIGLVLGVIIAIVKVFSIDNKYLKIPGIICDLYTTIIRGTPVALQLFIIVFAILAIPGFKEIAVVLTFALNSSAYVSENIRAGIMSVDKGQMEAGRALGLSKLKTMIKIIFPQAIKNVIPSIGNELIALVKETSIVALVGSTVGTLTFDLNQATQTINKTIANYLAPAILAGILYLIIVYGITLLIKLFERRFAASDKR